MCYPVTHVCQVCLGPVRVESNCRGDCFIKRCQTNFIADEYCALHTSEAGDMPEYQEAHIIATENSYLVDEHITDIALADWADVDAPTVDGPYAQDVGEYEVLCGEAADNESTVTGWSTATAGSTQLGKISRVAGYVISTMSLGHPLRLRWK
ncbi:hypothetical protein F5B22DRAFT_607362 [Xylaria bambusicola]|uniref:uncharacterized protein n=1 Tax=Xylaria bambusicola TaxID=326684 RepID=UPI002008296F|nr:uncharacterized protein F5B22DRAFT_607362 [Xylaria bambusicola]KAI0515439.1 hypothetical protein F5B22DRAFT_607362 [Xylaria bambusicola]